MSALRQQPRGDLRITSVWVTVCTVLTQSIRARQGVLRAQNRTPCSYISFHGWFHDGDQLDQVARHRRSARRGRLVDDRNPSSWSNLRILGASFERSSLWRLQGATGRQRARGG